MIDQKSLVTLGAFAFCAYSAQGLMLNEMRTDQPDNPDDEEFVEIKGTPGESLDGVWFIYIGDHSGDGAFKGSGTIERALDLTGFSIPDDGIFLMIGPGFDGVTMGIDPSQVDYVFDGFGNALENSDNVTALLVRGFTEGEILVFDDQLGENAVDIDDDDDGVPNATLPWTEVIDAVSLVETPDSGDLFYGSVFGGTDIPPTEGGFVASHAYRASDTEEWLAGEYVLFEEDADGNVIGLNPNAVDSPGTVNPLAPPDSFEPSIDDIDTTFAGVGDTFVVTGENLNLVTMVTVGGAAASFLIDGGTLTVTVPEAATTGPVEVTNPDGTDDSAGFIVVVDPASLVFAEDFSGGIGDMSLVSAASDADWELSSFGDAEYIEANGFGADVASDDWAVTPEIDLTSVGNPFLVLGHRRVFGGPALEVLVSSDWDGVGSPATGTWTALTVTLAGDNTRELTDSGMVDLSAYEGETIYVAIRYTTAGTGPGEGAIDQIYYLAVGGDTAGWELTPELGWVYQYGNGWGFHFDLGFIFTSNYPWLYQSNFADLFVVFRSAGVAMWLYSPTLGYIYLEEGAGGDFSAQNSNWATDNFITPQG
jgi:hypothetical protein